MEQGGPPLILEEILIKIPQLTSREQLLILEAVSRALRTDLETRDTRGSAERLLGVIKAAGDLTDEDLDRIRFEHLMEKHS
jgi:hypothetical protein